VNDDWAFPPPARPAKISSPAAAGVIVGQVGVNVAAGVDEAPTSK